MTDLTALDELIKAVEAGNMRFAEKAMIVLLLDDTRLNQKHMMKAYHGSLDAAKALHDALLPGCSQYSIITDPTCLCVKVAWWPNGLSGEACWQGEGWSEDIPARAWLLAILRAYRAQIGGAA